MIILANLKRVARHRPGLWGNLPAGLVVVWLVLPGTAARAQVVLPPATKMTTPAASVVEPERVFRLESEAMLRERMTREARVGINPLNLKYEAVFPEYPPVSPPIVPVRFWPPSFEVVEPLYLCYGRLYFEQINQERYGWDLGPLQPLISAGIFYFDVATLPYHAGTDPLRCYECNPGYALPGQCVPLLLYKPEWSWTGVLAEAGTVGLMFWMFP
jgi:hypothetical protein